MFSQLECKPNQCVLHTLFIPDIHSLRIACLNFSRAPFFRFSFLFFNVSFLFLIYVLFVCILSHFKPLCYINVNVMLQQLILFAWAKCLTIILQATERWVTFSVANCLFSALVHSVFFIVVFGTFFIPLPAMKEGKAGSRLIQEWAMKGNGFDTGLTSETTLHRSLQRKIPMQSSLWRETGIVVGSYQIIVNFSKPPRWRYSMEKFSKQKN